MTPESEIINNPDAFDPIGFWFDKLDVAKTDMVMIVPSGSTGGQGFQGELVDIVFVNSLPYVVIIKNMVSGPVVIPWHSIAMITKVQAPEVDAQTLKDIQAEFERKTGLSPDDVEQMTSTQMPDDVSALTNNTL